MVGSEEVKENGQEENLDDLVEKEVCEKNFW